MITKDIFPIKEQLDRIESKIDGNINNKFLDIKQASNLTSTSASTLRRAVKRSELKCSRRLGKLLFLESDIRKWLENE
tara:strand:+ start:305 stop:538 length:234 start_codon:yes stop_codon:yes gene_type:complete